MIGWGRLLVRFCALSCASAGLVGCVSLASIADRAWMEPPYLSTVSAPDGTKFRVLPGVPGVLFGDSNLVAVYGLLGLPFLTWCVSFVLGGLPLGWLLPAVASDLVIAVGLQALLPPAVGTTGDLLVVRTLRGPERLLLERGTLSGALEAEGPPVVYRMVDGRVIHLMRAGRAVASWHLRRQLRSYSIGEEGLPSLKLRVDPASHSIRARVFHPSGFPLQGLTLKILETVPRAAAGLVVEPQMLPTLVEGQEGVFVLRRPLLPARGAGHARVWLIAGEHLGWASAGTVAELHPEIPDPQDRPVPVVLARAAPEAREAGVRTELILGLASVGDADWERAVVKIYCADPEIVVEQSEVNLGAVILEQGTRPVAQLGVWQKNRGHRPVGLRLEVEASRAGQTLTWFEDYWWQDVPS